MQDAVNIGVHILETLTTGMYRDPLVIYREYIQNACDAIDSAVKKALIEHSDSKIEIEFENNSVTITDNGIGIPAEEFKRTLYSIGESQKTAGLHRGFRGIGHWCGFAHCTTLVFTAKAVGESIESVMACNADKLRSMMLEHRLRRAQYSIDEVLSSTITFTTNIVSDIDVHYFKVELIDVVDAKEELCDLQKVKDYLSFTIPVGCATEFLFYKRIHDHAKELGTPIHEYNVTIDGEAVLKKYQPSFTIHGKGEDTITDVQFKEFKDEAGKLIAWMWFGVSSFKGQMAPANKMRGIRLRSQNIQIGAEDTLQKLFNESHGRGLYYYIGEVFAISNELLPDSQRDYFEPGEARTQFERSLSDFFNDELKCIYYAGSEINSAYNKIEKADQLAGALAHVDSPSPEQLEELKKAQEDAEKAKNKLSKVTEKAASQRASGDSKTVGTVVHAILKKNEAQRTSRQRQEKLSTPVATGKIPKKSAKVAAKEALASQEGRALQGNGYVSLATVIAVVRELTDTSTADAIIAKIKEDLN